MNRLSFWHDCDSQFIAKLIGTCRHFSTRVREHLIRDKSLHIYKHLLSSNSCKQVSNENCFTILETAKSSYQLKIKGALYINCVTIPLFLPFLIHLNFVFLSLLVISFIISHYMFVSLILFRFLLLWLWQRPFQHYLRLNLVFISFRFYFWYMTSCFSHIFSPLKLISYKSLSCYSYFLLVTFYPKLRVVLI